MSSYFCHGDFFAYGRLWMGLIRPRTCYVYGKQLLTVRLLALLAPLVQSLDRALPYVPLSGTHRLAATSALIFIFVALWHDLSPRLLGWGWLAVLFILPEIMAGKALPPSMVRASFLQSLTVREVGERVISDLGSLFSICSLDRWRCH